MNFASVFFKLEKLRFSGERSLLTSTFMIGAFKISSFDDQFYIPSSKNYPYYFPQEKLLYNY